MLAAVASFTRSQVSINVINHQTQGVAVPTKTAVRKPAKSAAKSEVVVRLDFTKATKNTFRFDNPNEDATITSLYVRKEAFDGEQPKAITVTVVPE